MVSIASSIGASRKQGVGLLDRVALEQRQREERRRPDPRPHDPVAVADLERGPRVRLGPRQLATAQRQ